MNELEIRRKATLFLQEGRYDSAIAEYQLLLDSSKRKHPSILNLLGDIYVKKGDYEQGFRYFLRASKAYSDEGLFHNGIAVAKKILRIDKEQVEVYAALAVLYARQGLGIDCVKFLSEYARLKSESAEMTAALAAFAEACEILPSAPELFIAYAGQLEGVGRFRDAAGAYTRAAELYTERGLEAFALEMRDEARRVSRGEAPVESSPDGRPGVKDLMNLRLLDDDASPELPAVRPRPAAPASATASKVPPQKDLQGDSFPVYDPKLYPHLPPPPPLPGAPSARPKAPPPLPGAPSARPQVPPAQPPPAAGREPIDSLRDLRGVILPPSMQRGGGGQASSALSVARKKPVAPEGDAPPPAFHPPQVKPHALDDDASDEPAPLPPVPRAAVPPRSVDGRAVVVGDDADIVRDGGEATRVIADFQQATSELLSPGDSQAHFDLGTTYLEMELFDEAAAEFQFAARDETLAVASQEMLGYVFLRQGRLDVAVGELQKGLALSRDGDHRQLGLLYNLGIAYGAMDRQQDAIASFSRILVVDSTFRDVRSRLERLLRAQ